MRRNSRIIVRAVCALAAIAAVAPRAVKAYDQWQETRRQAWMAQAKAAIESGQEQLPPVPLGVTLVDDVEGKPGQEMDDPQARELQQLLMFGSRTPEYQADILRTAVLEQQKATAIATALQTDRTVAPLAGIASSVVAANLGPAGARSEFNGSFYKAQDTGRIRAIRVHPADANTVYIATSGGGLWKTTNFHTASPQWAPLMDSLVGSIDLGAMDIDPSNPSTIYVGTGEHGDGLPGGAILKSTDGGATWSTPVQLTGTYTSGTSSVTATSTQVRSLAVDPNNSNIVVASGDRAFYRSVDGGATWAVINLPAPAAYNLSATFTQAILGAWDIVYLGTASGQSQWALSGVYGCPGFFAPVRFGSVANCTTVNSKGPTTGNLGDIWKSADSGVTWTSMRVNSKLPTQDPTWGITPDTTGLPDIGRTALGGASNVDPNLAAIYAEGASVDDNNSKTVILFSSRDGGATWNKLGTPKSTNLTNPTISTACTSLDIGHNQSWYNLAVGVDPGNPDRAMVGGNLCSARTVDGGATWQLTSHWLPSSGTSETSDGAGALPYVHADWHTITISRVGGRFVTLVGCDGGLHSSYSVFDITPTQLASWNQPDYGLITHLPYGHGTGDPVLGNARVFYAGFQDNGTRWRLSHTENVDLVTTLNWDQIVGGDGTGNAVATDVNGQNAVYWGGTPGARRFCRPTQSRDCGVATHITDGTEFSNWIRALNPNLPSGDSEPFTLRFSPTYDSASSVISASTFNVFKISVDSNDAFSYTRLTPAGLPGGRNTQLQAVYASPWPYQINGTPTRVYGVVVTGGRFVTLADTGVGTPTLSLSATQMQFNGTTVTGSSSMAFPRVPEDFGAPTGTAVTNTYLGATVNPTPAAMGKLFKTIDNGAHWIPVHGNGTPAPGGGTLDLPNIPVYVVRVDYSDPTEKTWYVGTELGFYRTTDGGNTWARYGSVPAARIIDATVSLNGSLIRLSAYGRGLWEMYPHSENGSAAGDGDWDKNGVVDFRDLIAVSSRLGKTQAMNDNNTADVPAFFQEPRYDAASDTNSDGNLDDTDLGGVIAKFGGTP